MSVGLLSPKPVTPPTLFDRWLLVSFVGLIALGLLMVTSASIVIAERQFGGAFHYVLRQVIFLCLGLGLMVIVLRLPLQFWQTLSPACLLVSIALLCVVLVPGIGRQINGSTRWLNLGFFGFQVSEFAKFSVIVYLAGYLVRHQADIAVNVMSFLKPMVVLALMAVLLLLEPDFGSTVVLLSTALGMLFLAGARLWQFLGLLALVGAGLGGLAIASPYRLARLTTFLNPWANQFDSGYQLTQSLIAFGRGGLWGVGLGGSVQKLFYLPEAHTDFLFAVLAEELGLVGELLVIGLFTLLVSRLLIIGLRAYKLKQFFSAYIAYGFALWLGLQAIVNIGVNAGLLPTKGLTLPFMSYGGSSLLILCLVMAVVLRIDYEIRFANLGFGPRA